MKPALIAFILTAQLISFSSPRAAGTQWELDKSTDPFTDETVAIAIGSSGVGINQNSAVVRCKGMEFSTYFNFREYLGNDLMKVRYRVNKEKPVEDRWFPSSKGTAIFAGHDAHLARLLMTGDSFVIEVTDYRGVGHAASFDLSGSYGVIAPVLEQCRVAEIGLHEKVVGLRMDIALELERWGPRNISVKKQILASLGKYDGPNDSSIEPEFAPAVQAFYDAYIEQCRRKDISGTSCRSLQIFWDHNMKPVMPSASSLIYERASGSLKEQAGKLKIGD